MIGIRSLLNVIKYIPMWLQIVIVIFALIALEQAAIYASTNLLAVLSGITLAYLSMGALGIFIILVWICHKESKKP